MDYDASHYVIFCSLSLLLTLSCNKPHKRHAHNLCRHFTSISSAARLPHTRCSDTDSALPHITADVSVYTFTVSPWLNKPDDHSLVVSWLWQSLVSHHRGPGSIPVQSMWGVWWTQWQWYMFLPHYFRFALSVSFHKCSIHICLPPVLYNLSSW